MADLEELKRRLRGTPKRGAVPQSQSQPQNVAPISEEQKQRGAIAGADPELAVQPSFFHEAGQSLNRAVTAPVKKYLGDVKQGWGAVGQGASEFSSGLLATERPGIAQPQQTAQQPGGALRAQTVGPQLAEQPEEQPVTQPPTDTSGQIAATGMSPNELAQYQQKAWNHPNPQIQQWARSGPGGGIVQKRNRQYIPVIDQNTGLPTIDERTGMMKHIEVIRGSASDHPQSETTQSVVDPRAGIAARKLAAGKEKQTTGFGATQAEALYKSADELMKAAASSDNPQENYTQATRLREQADQIFGALTGKPTPGPTKTPTKTQIRQFNIESDPVQLEATRKYFMDEGESGKKEFMSLPIEAQNAIFPPR